MIHECWFTYATACVWRSESNFLQLLHQGPLHSVQWLTVSIPLLYLSGSGKASQEAAISDFPASKIVSRFGDCIWDGSPGGAVSGWPFLQSRSHFVSIFPPVSNLFPLLRNTEESTLWSSFFLSLIWSMNCTLGIPSVSVYHVWLCVRVCVCVCV